MNHLKHHRIFLLLVFLMGVFYGFSIYNFVTSLGSSFETGLEAWNRRAREDLTVYPEAFGLRLQAVGIGDRKST